jgi:putative ABC transport system substrate-binding protein
MEVHNASTSGEIDSAFSAFELQRPDAVFVAQGGFFMSRRVQLAQMAARHALPTSYPQRDFVEVGGLMSYGANVADSYRQVGIYTGRILKGARPADLPVVQASRFDLVINRQTARMQNITVPSTFLALADEIIE